MKDRIKSVRVLDDSPTNMSYEASDLDPRNAMSVASRDMMIQIRREAGLSDFPARPLVPEFVPNFLPDQDQVAAD